MRIPLAEAYYKRTFELGYYPPEADSIGIPIASEAITTIMSFPFVVAGLCSILRPFPARCSWLVWNEKRGAWSAFWTLLFAFCIFQTADFMLENWRIGLPLNAMVNVGWILVWLELRAVLVSKLSAPRASIV